MTSTVLAVLLLVALAASQAACDNSLEAQGSGRMLQAACGATSTAKRKTFKCDPYPLDASKLPPCGKPLPPLSFKDAAFYARGAPVNIHGINWFGFNNGATMVDALWAGWGKSQAVGDFASVVYQQKLLGFNTVRLPFRFTDLFEGKPAAMKHGCPSQSSADIVKHALHPSAAGRAAGKTPPAPLTPLPEQAGSCNAFVPENSVLARYLYVLHYYVQSGFYVVVDYHPTRDKDEPHIPKDPKLMISYWVKLWKIITCSPRYETDLKGRLLLDIFNEPDAHKIGWNTGLGERLLGVMDALDKLTPGQNLYLIQGGGQHWFGFGWGDGFITDPKLAGKWMSPKYKWRGRIHDANPFFRALLTRAYRTRVALAPHLYSNSVIKYKEFGKWQYIRHSKSWGYLMKTGYCVKGACQKFPVVAGEMGSRFKDPSDIGYYKALSKYMRNVGDARDGQHVAFNNWIWWTWNANSVDTGGLTTDDFSKIDWAKVDWLTNYFGLRPWYTR